MPTIQKTKQIFEFIKRYIASNGVAPTIAEMCRQFGMSSPASVHEHLRKMEALGWITIIPNVTRGIRLMQEQKKVA